MKEKQKTLSSNAQRLQRVLLSPEVSITIPLIALCIYTGIQNPAFFALKNIQIILRYCAFVGALAIGQSFVLMTGEIDLSIGTNSTFTSIVFAYCAVHFGWPPLLCVLAALLAGAAVGFLNGYLSFSYGLSSWISTLATQYVCIGLATVISTGKAVGTLDTRYSTFASARPLGLTWMFWIVFAIYVLAAVYSYFTVNGRKVLAVGISPEASRIAGTNVRCVKWGCMVFAGVMAGVCGILQTINTQSGSPTTGLGNEFPSIICCAIGGISVSGGKGGMLGVLFGVVMFQTMKNCLQSLRLDNNVQLVVTGSILLLAVAFDIIKGRAQRRNGV